MPTPLNPAQAATLQRGLAARQQGRFAEAAAAYRQVLLQAPGQPDALHLMGELAHAQGQLAEAEDLLDRAARAAPRQPVIRARLASVREAQGRLAEAETSLRELIELQPEQVEAHYNRARLLRLLNRRDDALHCTARALAAREGGPALRAMTLQLRALLQSEAGAVDDALATLDAALQLAPQRAALHHNRAVLLQRQGRHADALLAHAQALRLGLDAADAHYNLGNTLQSLGRLDDALAAYRAALQRQPQHELALFDIARLRWRLGHADFTAELDAAIAAAPESAMAPGLKGRLLLRAERYAEATAAFARAAELAPGAPVHLDGLGQSLLRQGRAADALEPHRRAVELAPTDASYRSHLALALLHAGDQAAAEAEALEALRLAPQDQHAWATIGLVWRARGDAREAWLHDLDRHVQVFDLPPPAGWPDIDSFNRALAALLESRHLDAVEPIDQTLRHGSQTAGRLFDLDDPLIAQLKVVIGEAIDRYVASLSGGPRDPDHPLTGRATARWHYTDSWSSRLREGGFHTRHVHPHGWISSCYYVAVPSTLGTGDGATPDQAGWIEFGAPALAPPAGVDFSPRRAVRPRAGRLVLFPSYLWHGTVPFRGDERRLTVAFDVVPDA
jgi:uncharacterized protein (TIGR02466 family)